VVAIAVVFSLSRFKLRPADSPRQREKRLSQTARLERFPAVTAFSSAVAVP
jgi:hypothetical protein